LNQKNLGNQPWTELWESLNDLGGSRSSQILRRGLLKEILFFLHSELSRALALGHESRYEEIIDLEKNLSAWKTSPQLCVSFEDLLHQTPVPAPLFCQSFGHLGETHPEMANLPQKLLNALNRPDREWERMLVFETFLDSETQWKAETLALEISLENWANFETQLKTKFFPKGLILFTESVVPTENPRSPAWISNWWVLHRSPFPLEGFSAMLSA
jgi:hypothetical protein